MESFIINYQQEAPSEQQDGGPPNSQDGGHPNPQDGGDRNPDGGNLNFQNSAGNLNLQKSAGNSKKRKLSFLPCGKSCGPDDKVTPCPGSKRDKSIGTNTDGSKKHRKKTQTDKNLLQRPDVVDVEVSVPGLVDESVGVSADQLPDRSGAQQAHDRSGLQQGHSDGSEQNDDAGLQQGHDDAGDQQVDDRPGQPAHDRSRRRDRSRPEEDGDPQEHDGGSGRNKRGSKKKSTSPEAVPGPSGLQKKSNKSNKDDDCGCTESNKLRGCLVHEEPEPEMDELFDSTGSVVEKTFDDVHNLTRTIQERLDSINETISDARRDSRPVGSRRSGSASFILETSPSTDRVVIEESSTSLVIETSRTPRTRRSSGRPGPSSLEPEPETPQRRIPTPTVPPPLAKAPKKRLVRKTVPQVASAPAASPMRQPVPVSTRTSPVQPEQVQVPSRPSAQVQPRPSPRPPLQSSTRPPPIQTPTRPPPAQSTRPPPVQSPRPGPAEASPRPGPDQVPPRPGPDQVPPRPGPVQAPPRPGPVEVPPRPGSFEAPSRPGPVEAQPRPRPDQGPPRPGPVEVPPRSPAKKSKTKKPPAQCNLSRCHKCPGQSRIPTRPSPHVQFPQILNLLPLHTSSPITSHQTISNPKPSHHYFLRSHAKKVYTTNPTQAGSSQDLPTGATQRRSHSPSGETRRHTSRRRHSRESSSGTSGSSIRITRKKTRKLSTESEYGS